jgi:ribose 1,5-bisphosphokinase PhnN
MRKEHARAKGERSYATFTTKTETIVALARPMRVMEVSLERIVTRDQDEGSEIDIDINAHTFKYMNSDQSGLNTFACIHEQDAYGVGAPLFSF